ncbi:MAG: hypothetical protein ACRD4S_17520 [Candidatus Acidiferrales bacterium]
MEITPQQSGILKRLQDGGFGIAAFPMYADYIGVRKGNCAALLAPDPNGGFRLFGAPSYLLGDNFSARVGQNGHSWFVWKQNKLEATPERIAELDAFSAELSDALLQRA